MSCLLEHAQTSGNDWGAPSAGVLSYALQESTDRQVSPRQLVDVPELEKQMARFEAEHRALINDVRRHYVAPTDPSLKEYFDRYRAVPQLLIEAVPHLRRYFGDVVFALRLTWDEYGWQTLYVDALWPGEARDAIEAIDAFEDGWWIKNSHAASGSLTFTYRLV